MIANSFPGTAVYDGVLQTQEENTEFCEMSRNDPFSSIQNSAPKSPRFGNIGSQIPTKESVKLKEKRRLALTDRGNNMDGVNNLQCPHPIGSSKEACKNH